jgi:hypothetical protein
MSRILDLAVGRSVFWFDLAQELNFSQGIFKRHF